MWDELSEELQRMILIRAGFKERLSLEQCSHTLCTLFRSTSELWNVICFPSELKPELTDSALSSLLKRVKARVNTCALDLNGCSLIRGDGLAPLAGSTVLKELHLKVRGIFQSSPIPDPLDRLDHEAFATLIPADGPNDLHDGPLRKLHIHRQHDRSTVDPPVGDPHSTLVDFDEPWQQWLRKLAQARFRDQENEESRCGNCECSLEEVLGRGPFPPWSRQHYLYRNACDFCEERTCEAGFGTAYFASGMPCGHLYECRSCGLVACQNCSMSYGIDLAICADCHPHGITYCAKCRYVMPCAECLLNKCIECQPQIEYACNDCMDHFCLDCRQLHQCLMCGGHFCADCGRCEDCGDTGEEDDTGEDDDTGESETE